MALKSTIGALNVEITGDSKKLQSELKNAGTALRKGGRELRNQVNQWGKWGAAATTAIAGVAATLVKSNLSNIRELDNMAKAGNTTVATLQQQSFAAQQAGISQEKYADILKDVNDRIGDFVQTGAGPMVDFFEKVAPKVGVTVEQFRKLSGPDALQLYVTSLEKANLNQQDMTFFMEAMSSESTKLLPLLKDGGAAMRSQADAAKRLGIGLSEIDVQKAIEAQQALDKMEALIGNQLTQATAELAPFITQISNEFFAAAENSGGFAKHTISGLESVGNAVAIMGNGIQGIKIIFQTLKVAALGFTSLVTFAFQKLAQAVTGIGNTILQGWQNIFGQMARLAGTFSDDAKETMLGIAEGIEGMKADVPDFVNDLAASQMEGLRAAKEELHNMAMEPLPTEQFEQFVETVKKKVAEAAPAIKEGLTGGGATPDSGGGEGDDESNKVAKFEQETVGLLEAMGFRFQSQNEMRIAQMEREKQMLQTQFENGEIAAREHAERMTEIQRNMEETKRQITVDNLQQGFQAMAQNSKKVQKLMQGVAIVQAVIKGKQAAVDAWQAGMSVGGPWAPIVAAAYTAASIARTSSMIQSIKSGGKSMSSGGGGGGAARAAQSASAAGGGTTGGGGGGNAGNTRSININMMGSAAMQQWMRDEIIPAFNQALGDNVELNTGG